MLRLYYTTFFLTLICFAGLQAQERMVVSNASANREACVWIKWYDEKVFYPEGVNVYRVSQTDGQRIKLNRQPIRKGAYQIPEHVLTADTTLKNYMAMVQEAKPDDVKGFLSLLLIVKTFENNEFAKHAGIMYEDCTGAPGQAYSYELYELASDGKEMLIEASPYISVTEYTSAPPPDSLAIVAGDSRISMRWKPETKRYWGVNIYRKTDGDTAFILRNDRPIILSEIPKADGSTGYPDIFFDEENLQNDIAYTYKVQGIDYFARSTLFSEEITVTPKDKTPPSAPHNVNVKVGLLDITLSWQHDSQSPDMKGYNIYRTKGRNGKKLLLNNMLLPVEQRIYYDTVPEPGTFIYQIAAVDSLGNEGFSFLTIGEVLDIFPPAPPTGLQVVADTGRIVLSWNANRENDLMGYRVYRTVGNNREDNYVLLNTKIIRDTLFTDSLPRNAKNFFFYKIIALDSSYNKSPYSAARSARMPDVIPPRAPFIINVSQEAHAIRVEWLNNAESDLAGYHIYRFQPEDSAGTVKRLNIALLKADMHLFTDNWAMPNTSYRYYLTAIDSSENVSLPSTPYDGKMIADEACPFHIKKLKTTVKKNGTITISWNINTEKEDACQGGVLYRRNRQTNAYQPVNTLSTDTKYTDQFEDNDTRYYYQVRVYGTNGCVVKSAEVEAKRK
jgi:hypothetical protein